MTNPIYLFDGHCVLCSRAVHYVLRYEKAPEVRFVAIKSTEGRKLAAESDVDPDKPHTFLFVHEGKIYDQSDAVIALAQFVGGPGKIVVIGKFLPRAVRDWFYARIALNRYKLFGRMEQCYLPTPENRDRFVLT